MVDTTNPPLQPGQQSAVPLTRAATATMRSVRPGVPGQEATGTVIRQKLIPIGEETIQIVPHPTTNRFPWSPVENPKVQVFQTVIEVEPGATPVPPPSLPVASVPIPEPLPSPTPVVPPAPPPVPDPTLPAVTQPKPAVMPSAAPVPPRPALAVRPVSPAPASLSDITPMTQTVDIPISHPVSEPVASVMPAPTQPQAAERTIEKSKQNRTEHIYSEYTRKVWHVFRPNIIIAHALFVVVLLLIGGVVWAWLQSGASTDMMTYPFIKNFLSAE